MAGLFANRPSRTVLGSMLRRSTSTAAVLDRLLEAASHQDSDPKAFLQVLEGAAVDLQVVKADRSYRQDFTGNYRLIFPDEGRRYNTDIMHACQVGRQDIWVNGTFHESDASMKRFAEDVRRCFNELQKLLRAWSQSSMLSRTPQVKPLLTRLDIAWASFEQHYVMWLIQIESQAFAPLMAAISLEKELFTQECQVNKFRLDELTRARQLAQSPKRLREPSEGTLCRRSREVSGVSSPCSSRHPSNADSPCSRQKFFPEERVQFGVDAESESRSTNIRTKSNLLQHTAYSASRRTSSACRKALERLVDQVAELNSLANVQGRGRKDLTVDVLQAAADVFKRFPEDDRKQSGLIDDQLASASASASASARRLLACRVLGSFSDLRSHLAEMQEKMSETDPVLSKNCQLVKLLVAWEDAWELGARFLLQPQILNAMCEVAARVANTQCFSQELRVMLEDSDAELFLVLPRLVLLCCLFEPSNAALLAMFLPHHIDQEEHSGARQDDHAANFSEEWKTLQRLFDGAVTSSSSSPALLWQTLARRAISGTSKVESGAIEGLMLKLEGLSMELQRHRPEEWNRCCSLLLQCVEAAAAAYQGTLSSL